MFTRETLNQLHALTQAVADAKMVASDHLKTAQDRYRDRKHKLMREGKEIELTEKVLWDETFYLGVGCDAALLLRKLHPDVFEAYKKQDEAAMALKKFAVVELGMNMEALTLSDYLKATEGLFELMLAERGFASKSPYQAGPGSTGSEGGSPVNA